MENNKSNCIICKAELVYSESEILKCQFCDREFEENVKCANGHFICNDCHSKSAIELILEYCSASESINPMQMADEIMQDPRVKMHGPEHHFLVPAVLITAYCNSTFDKTKIAKLKTAGKRASHILGGFCGFYGNCGAAVGTGIFTSIITGATPVSSEGWTLANKATASSLVKIAEVGGPRCCKRNTNIALLNAIDFIKENFNVELETVSKIQCSFSKFNNECKENNCSFYKIIQ
ncbi:MAG: hypothetical protein K9J13_12610 [Saprospiraceae bacterium]|nr:hypothetical protein [Saprospiraceae bacterium]